MKKTFVLSHPKIKYARLIDAAKHEANKYIKRERNKALPEGADFIDFACKYGPTEEQAETIHMAEISKYIDKAEKAGLESFYLEIISKAGYRSSSND